MPEPALLALMGAIVLLAFVAKGATGFGESLLIVPAFLLFMDIKVALPVVLITTASADVYLLYHHHRDVHRPGLWIVVLAAVVGVGGGTLAFRLVGSDLLRQAFAGFVLLFALRLLLEREREVAQRTPSAAWGAVAGLAAGFLDAVFGTGGPPLIIYFTFLGLPRSPFRATFVVVAFTLHLSRIVAYAATGLFTRPILLTGLCLIAPMILGALLGRRLHQRLDDALFRRIAAVTLLVVGAKLLFFS